ncbi:MAG: amidase family protein, partial [Planctomycetota bacterium]
ALSWSMDKLGPICRSADDAAIVFAAIHGPDGKDPAVRQLPFTIPEGVSIEGWKIGFLEREAASMEPYRAVIDKLRELGAELVPFTPPEYPGRALRIILNAEAAAAFDELTRSGKDELLVRQIQGAWPNSFRVSRLIPAVEYIQANRIRTVLMHDMHEAMDGIEAFVHPSFATLLLSNLTGHPTVVVPNGFGRRGAPRSISFTGQLFGESRLLAIARAWQEATGHHERHPELSGR